MDRSLLIVLPAALLSACTKPPTPDSAALSATTPPAADGPRSTRTAHQIGGDDSTKLCLTAEEPRYGARTWVADVDALFRATQEGNASWNALLLATGRDSLAGGADPAAAFGAGFNALLGLMKESGQLETATGPCAAGPIALAAAASPVPAAESPTAAAATVEPTTGETPTEMPTEAPAEHGAAPAVGQHNCREIALANPTAEAREVWVKYTDANGASRSLKLRAEAGATGIRLGWHSYETWTCENASSSCAQRAAFHPLCVAKLEVASRPWAKWVGGWSPAESLEGKLPYSAATAETLQITLK